MFELTQCLVFILVIPYGKNEELFDATTKLLQIMTMGQLLPPPLSFLHAIIEHFDPPEVAVILKESVWNYMREHVPSPVLYYVNNDGEYSFLN